MLLQGLSGDERHCEVEQTVGFARIEQGQDVGVLERRGQANLAFESLGAGGHGDLRLQHLERDVAPVASVGRPEHGRMATLADRLVHLIAIRNGPFQSLERVAQRTLER